MTRIDLRIDLHIDLPHASLLSWSQIPVSVIIRCKTLKNGPVENTARRPRLAQMRSRPQEQLAAGTVGVSERTFRGYTGVHIRRHFVVLTVNLDLRAKHAH